MTTAAGEEDLEEKSFADEGSSGGQKKKPKFVPVSFNQACIDRIQGHLGKRFIRRSKATFTTPDNATIVVCSVSKVHGEPASPRYWFAFHPHQADVLSQAAEAYVAYGCGAADTIALIPFNDFKVWLPDLNMTKLEDREYWHVHLAYHKGTLMLERKAGKAPLDMSHYLLEAK